MLMNAKNVHDVMTETGMDKHNPSTARLYKALMINSVLDFRPQHPIYMFHSKDDETVPFVNAQRAEKYFKGWDITFDFDHYGAHGMGALRFIINVSKQL